MTKNDMYNYGYFWEEMIPITAPLARNLFKAGGFVFKLYANDVDRAVVELRELEEHISLGGMIGTYRPCLDCSLRDACCNDNTDTRHMCGSYSMYAEIMCEFDDACVSYKWVKECRRRNEKATA